MAPSDPTGSPLDPTVDAVGPAAVRAFELLADETRLAILLALWDAAEPFADGGVLSFSTLRERVGYETSGNFSYHLEKLDGHFVESTDDGYRLAPAGHRLVRAVVAGTGLTDATLDPTPIDLPCPLCGGSLAITYADDHLYTVCRDCPGRFAADDDVPPGTIMGFAFDPAGLANRSPEEIFAASVLRAMGKFTMQMGGVCPACSGAVDASLHVCDDHEPEGVCSTCGRRDELQARWVCTVCTNAGHGSPGGNLVLHPRVVAFYAERGLHVGYDASDFADVVDLLTAMGSHEQELLSTDPLRVRVTVRADGDELRLVVDEAMHVVAVESDPDGTDG